MPENHPKPAIELLQWIADQKELVTVPAYSHEQVQELAKFFGLPLGPAYRKANSSKTPRRGVRVTPHGNRARLSDMPKRFWAKAEPLLAYLDGQQWILVRVFGYPNLDASSPDDVGEKFSPLQQPDPGYQWGGLLERANRIRETLDGVPPSGSVHIDNETEKIVPKAGPNTREVDAVAVRNRIIRVHDVQVYATPKGRVALAEASLTESSESERPSGTAQAADAELAEASPLDSFEDPVRVSWVAAQVNKRSDKLAEKMKRRLYPIAKVGSRNYCERKHAIAMFPQAKKYLTANGSAEC